MSRRRREYVSFLSEGRRARRRDIFDSRSRRPLRWILIGLLIGASGLAAVWYFTTRSEAEPVTQPAAPSTTVATRLFPIGQTGSTVVEAATLRCPEPGPVSTWTMFQGTPARTGCTATRTIADPVILWRTSVGILNWLNNPVMGDNRVYVGSAGNVELQPDPADGVYALDMNTGRQLWFHAAALDVNGVAYGDGVVVAAGDEGKAFALDAEDGSLLWEVDLGNSVFGNPLIVGTAAIVGDGEGELAAFDLATGDELWRHRLNGAIRGGASSDGRFIYAASVDREVAAFRRDGTVVWRQLIRAEGPEGDSIRIWAAPTVLEDKLVIGYVRTDFGAEPAIMSLDKTTGEVAWHAFDGSGLRSQWGNIRSSPAALGTTLFYSEPYSADLIAIDTVSGGAAWSATVGPSCVPHWPSPAITSGQVILPRHDGGLYSLDATDGSQVWSIYVGDMGLGGAFPAEFDEEFCGEQPAAGFSVLASPAIGPDGMIVVGTLEGFVVAIGDRNW